MPITQPADGGPVSSNNIGIWSKFKWWTSGMDLAAHISGADGNLPVNRFANEGGGYQVPKSDGNHLAATYYFSGSSWLGVAGVTTGDARIYLIGANNKQIEWFEELYMNLPPQLGTLFALASSAWRENWGAGGFEAPMPLAVPFPFHRVYAQAVVKGLI